jgi:hypothetical protein
MNTSPADVCCTVGCWLDDDKQEEEQARDGERHLTAHYSLILPMKIPAQSGPVLHRRHTPRVRLCLYVFFHVLSFSTLVSGITLYYLPLTRRSWTSYALQLCTVSFVYHLATVSLLILSPT